MTTKPLILTGTHLVINAECDKGGHIAVEILDKKGNPLPYFSLEDAGHFTGDSVRAVVTWKDNPDIVKLMAKAVKLRFHARNARLYSFTAL